MSLSKEEFMAKLATIPEEEPDEIDLALMQASDERESSGKDQRWGSLEEYQQEKEESGKLLLRIPKSLHSRLKSEAKQEGISLNQYILYRLSSK